MLTHSHGTAERKTRVKASCFGCVQPSRPHGCAWSVHGIYIVAGKGDKGHKTKASHKHLSISFIYYDSLRRLINKKAMIELVEFSDVRYLVPHRSDKWSDKSKAKLKAVIEWCKLSHISFAFNFFRSISPFFFSLSLSIAAWSLFCLFTKCPLIMCSEWEPIYARTWIW